MRLYNVRPSEREFSFGKMSVVALGERGRARKETLVPFHAPPPTYPVGEKLSEESNYIIGVSRSGAPKIMQGEGASPGWIAVLSGGGAYTRGTYGTVYLAPDIAAATHPRTAPVQILAEGQGAFGQAGRVGGWHEFLVTFSPSSDSDPVIFRVRPAGGAHKMERYFLVFTASAVYRVYDAERAAFEAATGIILPPSVEGWLDLADVKTQEPPAETEETKEEMLIGVVLTCTAHGKPVWRTYDAGRESPEDVLADKGINNPPPHRVIGPFSISVSASSDDEAVDEAVKEAVKNSPDTSVDLDDPRTWFPDADWIDGYLMS